MNHYLLIKSFKVGLMWITFRTQNNEKYNYEVIINIESDPSEIYNLNIKTQEVRGVAQWSNKEPFHTMRQIIIIDATKNLITQQLRTNIGRSGKMTEVIQLVCLTG